ncbi:MAG: ParB N-terminal domain-containing protein [Clostridia bacterium]
MEANNKNNNNDNIKLININDIAINKDNPRHASAMADDEVLVLKKLLETKKDVNKMYELIQSIHDNGWFSPLIIAVMYDEKLEKYLVYDGNRRLTALKILQNPKLATSASFSKKQKENIANMSLNISDDFYYINCCIFKEIGPLLKYILSIHTTESAALAWTQEQKDRFVALYGKGGKTILTIFKETFPDIFKPYNINNSTFERIFKTRFENILGYTLSENAIILNIPRVNFEKRLHIILRDIDRSILTTRTTNTVKQVEEYLNRILSEEELKYSTNPSSTFQPISLPIDNPKSKAKPVIVPPTNTVTPKQTKKNVKKEIPVDANQTNMFDAKVNATKYKKIKGSKEIKLPKFLPFYYINIDKLDYNINYALGIRDLACELQHLSKINYTHYPISYAFLVRSIFEQSMLYFLYKKLGQAKFRDDLGKNPTMDKLLNYIDKHKRDFFSDITITRSWNDFYINTPNGTVAPEKDTLDLIIHHPYLIRPTPYKLITLLNSGLYAIIQFLINS